LHSNHISVASCSNACPINSHQCYGAIGSTTAYQTCGDYNGDGCTEWSTPSYCASGQVCSYGGNCCPTGTCGWGGDGNFTGECVPNGQTRENSWSRVVCRNGRWKTPLNGWGCADVPYFTSGCETGTCVQANQGWYCHSCTMDQGIPQSCWNNSNCSSGQTCSYGVCCPSNYCGWGDGSFFTRQCVPDGEYRENYQARSVCRNGKWKTPLNGWGCNLAQFSDGCEQGTCRAIGSVDYCVSSLPIPVSAVSTIYETGYFCQGSCRSCTAQGFTCGIASDGCGGITYCGSCPSGQTCLNNKCTTCANACTSGTSQCNGTTGYQTCGDTNGDGCTEWGAVIACGANQTCKDGHCSVSCVSHAEQKCDIGNLYWYDSCGNKEEIAQNCGANVVTANFRCNGNWLQNEIITKDCVNNACVQNSSWSNLQDCSLNGMVCANSICTIPAPSDTTPPVLSGLGPSGTKYDISTATLTVTTNEIAECRYSFYNKKFEEMTLYFSGTISHTAQTSLAGRVVILSMFVVRIPAAMLILRRV